MQYVFTLHIITRALTLNVVNTTYTYDIIVARISFFILFLLLFTTTTIIIGYNRKGYTRKYM